MTTIAFDVDGTRIENGKDYPDVPRYNVINLLNMYVMLGYQVFVWSGGGIQYAQQWVDRLGLNYNIVGVVAKGSFVPDIAVDDEEVNLGKISLKV